MDDANLDDDNDHCNQRWDDYDYEADDNLDEEKCGISPRLDDIDEAQIDISKESLTIIHEDKRTREYSYIDSNYA